MQPVELGAYVADQLAAFLPALKPEDKGASGKQSNGSRQAGTAWPPQRGSADAGKPVPDDAALEAEVRSTGTIYSA